MKTKLLKALTVVILLLIPMLNYAQAPSLGTVIANNSAIK